MEQIDRFKKLLKDSSFSVTEEKRLPNDSGVQLRLTGGPIVNIYDNGTINVQGKGRETVQPIVDSFQGILTNEPDKKSNKVFVVYGHDTVARDQLEAMLLRWGLEPIILDQIASEGQTIIEKLSHFTSDVGFAVVLATPDDEGNRRDHPDEKAYRARQNVVLELGMLLTHLGRGKVAVLLKEIDKMERPSDIQGLIYIPFKDNLAKEAGVLLAKELDSQGFKIKIAKL